jgi:hypothetical protein
MPFVALKRLKAKAIQAQLESMYGTDACDLSTVKKWGFRFLEGSAIPFDDPMSGRPIIQDLAETLPPMLGE